MDLFDAQDAENYFAWPCDTIKHRFIDFTKAVFKDVQKAVYEIMSHSHTYQLNEFVQVARNDFFGPFETLKHHFIEYTQVVF
jgi:hypothetical protein